MEQDRLVRDAAAVEVWDEAKDKAEVEWVVRSPQDQAEIVYVRDVEQQSPMLPDNPVIKKPALSAIQE